MGSFSVDPAWVRSQAGLLGTVRAGIANDVSEAKDYGWAMGSGDVANHLEEVARNWGKKRKEILDRLDKLSRACTHAADYYEGEDNAYARVFNGGKD